MAVLGNGLMERRRGSLPIALRALDGKHGSYARLLWSVYLVPRKCDEHEPVLSLHSTNSFCLNRYGSFLPQPRQTSRHWSLLASSVAVRVQSASISLEEQSQTYGEATKTEVFQCQSSA